MAGEGSSKKIPPKAKSDCTQPAGTMNGSSRRNPTSQPNVPAHSTSASGTMKKKPLSKQAFARLALVATSDDLKPIRRPLLSDLLLPSDSEDSTDDSHSPEPKSNHLSSPFFNPDESDSAMSSGLSLSPSSKHQTARTPLSQPTSNIRPLPTMSNSPASNEDNERPNIVPHYAPPRRGFVTPTTDFDALMHFAHDGPVAENEGGEKRKRGKGKGKEKVKAEPREPGMHCSGDPDTPLMSWLRRAKEIGLRPGGGIAAAGNGGEGSSQLTGMGGTMEGGRSGGGAHSTNMGGTMNGGAGGHSTGGAGTMSNARGKAQTKRAARRTRAVPKRPYIWKDPSKKNKSGARDRKDRKGKGREE